MQSTIRSEKQGWVWSSPGLPGAAVWRGREASVSQILMCKGLNQESYSVADSDPLIVEGDPKFPIFLHTEKE